MFTVQGFNFGEFGGGAQPAFLESFRSSNCVQGLPTLRRDSFSVRLWLDNGYFLQQEM